MRLVPVRLLILTALSTSSLAEAQSLGSFTWQLQPYCNRVTVTVTQSGTSYTLDGFDDQCGSAQRAPVSGVATLNPNGTIQLGFTTVVANGLPVHVTAQVALPAASGAWRDNIGNSGNFVLGGTAPGTPRPEPSAGGIADGSVTSAKLAADSVDTTKIAPGAVGGTDINAGEVQRRITSSCSGGQLMTGVNADGSVSCASSAPGSADITAVTAGAGLSGGGTSGDVSLAVANAGITTAMLAAGAVGSTAIDENEVQRRVTGSCPNGQLMTAIGVSGTVTCAADAAGAGDVTAVSAGSGLTGGGPSGDVSLSVATEGITRTMVAPAAIGTGQIDTTAIQRRVAGTCASGTALRVVNEDGSVICEPTSAAGDITSVVAGAGLSGGAAAGDVTLAVNFAGGGAAATAARSDFFVAGTNNTAVGTSSLAAVVGGQANTAVGRSALEFNTAGGGNTAIGDFAARGNQNGASNTVLGNGALIDNTSGNNNIAIGVGAGGTLETGSNNIYVQAVAGAATETDTLRIGDTLARAFIGGIRGVTTGQNDAIAVVVDSNGQLGTISSSRRTKDNIADLGTVSRGILDLRPVQFTYKQAFGVGVAPVQYGLIAEEVFEVMPELVARSKDGQIETVKYHVLPTLLLAEVQRLERARLAIEESRDALAERVAALERLVQELLTASQK